MIKAMRFLLCWVATFACIIAPAYSQKDSSRFSLHFQQTIVPQTKLPIKSPYMSTNSLLSEQETQYTITSTIFAGMKLWKGGEAYFNPEISGGSGLSSARGMGGFTNGEAFRVGDTAPKIYLARLYFKQTIAFGNEQDTISESANQVAITMPTHYLRLIVGKYCLADFFDNNSYSHDPRSQFMNWSLMSTGAWDYPANTRGYTVGYVLEYRKQSFAVRISTSALPTTANGPVLNYDYGQNYGHVAEVEKRFSVYKKPLTIRLLAFYNHTYMGNYAEATKQLPTPDLVKVQNKMSSKYGFGLNIERQLSDNVGCFFRYSWNDGNNETWAFTEIDRSASFGYLFKGNLWKRANDNFGIAVVTNDISKTHAAYLAAGGYGFMLGDGQINYGHESIFETYYSINVKNNHLWLTPDYQFVVNPAYNKDRGPAHVFGLRVHAEF
jgi:high affinity Mn2+ porin